MTHEPITPADLELLNPEVQNSIMCFHMDLKYLPPDLSEVMGLHFTLLTAALIASQKEILALKHDISDAWATGCIGGVPLNLSPEDDKP